MYTDVCVRVRVCCVCVDANEGELRSLHHGRFFSSPTTDMLAHSSSTTTQHTKNTNNIYSVYYCGKELVLKGGGIQSKSSCFVEKGAVLVRESARFAQALHCFCCTPPPHPSQRGHTHTFVFYLLCVGC